MATFPSVTRTKETRYHAPPSGGVAPQAASPPRYRIIADEVIFDRSLPDRAFRVYAVLVSYCHDKPYCYPSQEEMGKQLERTRETINRAIKQLIASGHVRRDRRKGWRRKQGDQQETVVYFLPRLLPFFDGKDWLPTAQWKDDPGGQMALDDIAGGCDDIVTGGVTISSHKRVQGKEYKYGGGVPFVRKLTTGTPPPVSPPQESKPINPKTTRNEAIPRGTGTTQPSKGHRRKRGFRRRSQPSREAQERIDREELERQGIEHRVTGTIGRDDYFRAVCGVPLPGATRADIGGTYPRDDVIGPCSLCQQEGQT